MGTDSSVAPGFEPKHQPSCPLGPRPIITHSKTQSKPTKSNILNKPSSKITNKMGGNVASSHSLNQTQRHLHTTPYSERCLTKDPQPST